MQDAWWYATGGTRKGPVGFDFIREKVLRGEILPRDLVWKEGMAVWLPISDVSDLKPIIQALPPELPKTIEPPPLPSTAGPWRRFFARSIDFWVITQPVVFLMVLGGLQVSSGFASWLQKPDSALVIGLFAIPLVLAVEAILFWMFGSTVGKSLLGISVRTESSRQLTLAESFQRQMGVYVYGLGAGVPLVNLATMLRQYRRLKSGLQASYDENRFVVTAVRLGVLRYVLVVCLLALFSLMNGFLQILFAKHRDDTASANLPEMVVIPADDHSGDERPPHRVSVRSFALGKYEVTQGQWKAVMGSNPSEFKNCGDNCPVESVSWDDIQQYLVKLNQLTGNRYGYRLASEAEWEYAARAGCSTAFNVGGQCRDKIEASEANFDSNLTYNGSAKGVYRQKTIQVGSFSANNWGLHDMHGNVWEWVQDCFEDNYSAGQPSDGSAHRGNDSSCTRRVLRGGSWNDFPVNLHSAKRVGYSPGGRGISLGFRLARTLP